MNLLYICPNNPFGNKCGGDIASHAFLRAFSELSKGNIDLITAEELREHSAKDIRLQNIFFIKKRSEMKKIYSLLNGHLNRFIRPSKKIIEKLRNNYNYIVFDNSSISGPLVQLANKEGIRTITIHHNFEREYYNANSTKLFRFLFLHHINRWEKAAYKHSYLNLFLTSHDKVIFEKEYGYSKGNNRIIGIFEYVD